MSQAENLLNSLVPTSEPIFTVSYTPIHDYLIIDAEGRIINVPATEILFGVETDDESERKYFKCPRIVGDNIDLSTLNLRIHYRNSLGVPDKYIVRDVKVEGEYITFSWKLGGSLFDAKGTVYFAVCAISVDSDGVETCKWNTTLASGNILEGMRVNDFDYHEESQARDVLQQLLNIFDTEGKEVVQNVTNEGVSQISKVQDAGAHQIDLVESKGAETLATIPEDYTTTHNMADESVRKKSNAILLEETGTVISVDDSSDDYVRGLRVYGKTEQTNTNGYQLFDASRIVTRTMNGVTVTNNNDGSFSISGTQTGGFSTNYEVPHDEFIQLFKPGTLHVDSGQKTTPYLSVWICSGDTILLSDSTKTKSSFDLELTEEILSLEDSKAIFYISCASAETITVGNIKPMVYQDGDGTWEKFSGGKPSPNPEYPQELNSVENVNVKVFSKNLIQNTLKNATNAGITYTLNDDGSITLNGTSTGDSYYTFDFHNEIPVHDVDLIVSYEGNNGQTTLVVGYFTDEGDVINTLASVNASENTFRYPKEAAETRTFIAVLANTTFDNLVVRPMIRLADTDSTFENGDKQAISISQTLRGIPVETNGNYTDSNGQQWVCDEIDFERGVYVQRVRSRIVTGNEYITVGAHSNGQRYATIPADGIKHAEVNTSDMIRSDKYIGSMWSNEPGHVYAMGVSAVFTDDRFTNANAAAEILRSETPTIMYPLTSPIEIPLTADELNAFRTLHTNRPITNVFNDKEATMSIAYNADTKTYIAQNYVSKRMYDELVDRVLALEKA